VKQQRSETERRGETERREVKQKRRGETEVDVRLNLSLEPI